MQYFAPWQLVDTTVAGGLFDTSNETPQPLYGIHNNIYTRLNSPQSLSIDNTRQNLIISDATSSRIQLYSLQ